MSESSSSRNLADTLRAELDRYPPGGKLPSSRALVDRFGVSPVTVSRALAELVAEGLVITRPGAGAFRALDSRRPNTVDTSWQELAMAKDGRTIDATGVTANLSVPQPGVIAFNGGYLHPSLQPELGAAVARAARRPDAWQRPPLEGITPLRAWFARELGVTAAEVLITTGGQAALATVLHALNGPVLVESPTYPGVLSVARAAGPRPIPVPMDDDGVRLDLLADAFAATGARIFYCQPLLHNPTGVVLATERRRQLIEIAHDAGAFVVEDDYARRLGHGGQLPPPLITEDPYGTVVHIGSLTKATSPNLRVGALVARGPVLERLRAIQVVDHFFVPRPLQEAALDLLSSPAWTRHLKALGPGLRDRRDAMLAALHREGITVRSPIGGYYLWLRLEAGTDETALTANCLRAGVAISPGRPYFAGEAPAPHLRLSFADTAGPDEINEGIQRLGQAINA